MVTRRVIYTCLMGERETLVEQAIERSGDIDYFCFTDDSQLTSEFWSVVQVPQALPGDAARSSRYIKFLGHKVLQGYEEWLWIDNRVRLKKEPVELFDVLAKEADLSLAPHDHRSSLRGEINAVIRLSKDHPFRVREFEAFLERQNPEILGTKVFAGTLILRRNSPAVREMMRGWLDLVLRFSRRDQLTFPIALSRTSVRFKELPIAPSGSELHEWLPPEIVRKTIGEQCNRTPRVSRVSRDLLVAFIWRIRRKISLMLKGKVV